MKFKQPEIFYDLNDYEKFCDIICSTNIKKMELCSGSYNSSDSKKNVKQFLKQNNI